MLYFVKWIKNLAVFYIIASLIMHLIPGKNFQKYIRLFLGIITIIMLMKPIGVLLNLEDDFEKNFSFNYNMQMKESLKNELEMVDEMQKEAVIGDYTLAIKENIRSYVEGIEVTFEDADIYIELNSEKDNFGSITGMDIYISCRTMAESGSNPSEELVSIEIKKYLANFYNLDKRNINVYIS